MCMAIMLKISTACKFLIYIQTLNDQRILQMLVLVKIVVTFESNQIKKIQKHMHLNSTLIYKSTIDEELKTAPIEEICSRYTKNS